MLPITVRIWCNSGHTRPATGGLGAEIVARPRRFCPGSALTGQPAGDDMGRLRVGGAVGGSAIFSRDRRGGVVYFVLVALATLSK